MPGWAVVAALREVPYSRSDAVGSTTTNSRDTDSMEGGYVAVCGGTLYRAFEVVSILQLPRSFGICSLPNAHRRCRFWQLIGGSIEYNQHADRQRLKIRGRSKCGDCQWLLSTTQAPFDPIADVQVTSSCSHTNQLVRSCKSVSPCKDVCHLPKTSNVNISEYSKSSIPCRLCMLRSGSFFSRGCTSS